MNLAQAHCAVNIAANGGTISSPYFLVQGDNSVVIVFMLISLPFPIIVTTMNHKNEELQHPFDFLVIRQVLIAAMVCSCSLANLSL